MSEELKELRQHCDIRVGSPTDGRLELKKKLTQGTGSERSCENQGNAKKE